MKKYLNGELVDGSLKLKFSNHALKQLKEECEKANNHETGGILVGRYVNDLTCVVIQEVSQPPLDSVFGRTTFKRGIFGVFDYLKSIWANESRRYYIGEWHYHPSTTIIPSGTDENEMKSISKDANYKCKAPIMVIGGKAKIKSAPNFRAYVFINDSLAEFLFEKESIDSSK